MNLSDAEFIRVIFGTTLVDLPDTTQQITPRNQPTTFLELDIDGIPLIVEIQYDGV